MAQQIINTGALANDNTGDPLRTALTKANENFTELYADVATKADAIATSDSLAVLAQTDADTATALAGKADQTELDNYALQAETPTFAAPQTITLAQRKQLAENTGALVTLAFEIISVNIELDGDFTFELPRLPFDFVAKDISLTATLCDHADPADIEFHAELNHSDTPIVAQANHVPLPITGVCLMNIVSDDFKVLGGTPIKLNFTATRAVGSSAGHAFGLTIWYRGFWT